MEKKKEDTHINRIQALGSRGKYTYPPLNSQRKRFLVTYDRHPSAGPIIPGRVAPSAVFVPPFAASPRPPAKEVVDKGGHGALGVAVPPRPERRGGFTVVVVLPPIARGEAEAVSRVLAVAPATVSRGTGRVRQARVGASGIYGAPARG